MNFTIEPNSTDFEEATATRANTGRAREAAAALAALEVNGAIICEPTNVAILRREAYKSQIRSNMVRRYTTRRLVDGRYKLWRIR